MSEDPSHKDAKFDSAAFEEWVEKTAQNKDISRGEVLDQMLSSYWILEELTGMMDETEQDSSGSGLRRETVSNQSESRGDQTESHGNNQESHRQDAQTREDDEGGNERARGDPVEGTPTELIQEFQELRSAIMKFPDQREGETGKPASPRQDQPQRTQSASRTDDRLRRTLSDLQDRVEDLSDELANVQDKHDRDVADLQTDIEETLKTLEALETSVEDLIGQSELESLAVSFEKELSRIEDNTTELEGRMAQVEDSYPETAEQLVELTDSQTEVKARLAQLEESHAETAGRLAELADDQADIEGRLEREFDSIENVFQHLLDKTEDLEARIDATSNSHRDDMESVEDHLTDQEQLEALMREAQRKNISKAVCDNCETKVDLGLLENPHCPDCDRTYTGLVEGGWLPFDKPKLETEPIKTASDDLDDRSADPSDLLESPPSDNPRM